GVALARTALAAWDLIGGRLARPFDIAMPVSYAYWIVCSKAVAKLPKIVAFSDWLLAEAAEDAPQLDGLKSKPRYSARAARSTSLFSRAPIVRHCATQHRRERTLIGALGSAGKIQWRDRSSRRPRAGGTHCERLSQRRIVRNALRSQLLVMAMRCKTFVHGLAHHPEGGPPGRRPGARFAISP